MIKNSINQPRKNILALFVVLAWRSLKEQSKAFEHFIIKLQIAQQCCHRIANSK